ncbi:MAG: methyltransferase, CheR-type [Verrucomicrobiaceae bacterium]|nr:methyltransferase, CheR-type [Verrucomicrobiaceae bacterium]
MQPVLSQQEFRQFQGMIFEIAGISLSNEKMALVAGRLAKRLTYHQLESYGAYFQLLRNPSAPHELQIAVDLLTTNETYFFREPKHFELLRNTILPPLAKVSRPVRVWSGASSSGEEIYTIAMVMQDVLGDRVWDILGSDISTRVLEQATQGVYPMLRAKDISPQHLSKYCLKGVGAQAGNFIIDKPLRSHVKFMQINLNTALPALGEFDVIFLRNVMIYFDTNTKRQVLARMVPLLRSGGYFIVSHSETLNGITSELKMISPSIYRKP